MLLLRTAGAFPDCYLLVSHETNEAQHLRQYNCTLHDFFKTPEPEDEIWFWNSFAEPVKEVSRTQRLYADFHVSNMLSPLERLPVELIEHILDSLIDAYDIPWKRRHTVLALGLSSPVLYSVILAYIHRDHARRITTSWTGKRVGFHGEYSFLSPQHMLAYSNVGSSRVPLRVGNVEWQEANLQPGMEWRIAITEVRKKWKELNHKGWQDLEKDISQAYKHPQDRVWVLRNLTTRQIVRSDKLAPPASVIAPEAINALEANVSRRVLYKDKLRSLWRNFRGSSKPRVLAPLSLAQILLVLTADTDAQNIPRLEKKFEFQHGVWASHTFDVVTLDEHVHSLTMSDERWTNVSAPVTADVGHLRWCIQQAELARTWPTLEKLFWDDVIKRGRREWRWRPDGDAHDSHAEAESIP